MKLWFMCKPQISAKTEMHTRVVIIKMTAGTLTISGSGAMTGYYFDYPWNSIRPNINNNYN